MVDSSEVLKHNVKAHLFKLSRNIITRKYDSMKFKRVMRLKNKYESLEKEYTKANNFIDRKLEGTLNKFDKLLDKKKQEEDHCEKCE